jgi:F-type H+-transporting ATPase subunit b
VTLFKIKPKGRCKMLSIEPKWLIVLAINFLLLLFILNLILFKPLLNLFKQREDTVKGSLNAAKEMSKKREENIASLNKELSDARNKAKETFESLKAEGSAKNKEMLDAAQAEVNAILEKARGEVKTEAEKARKALKAEVEKFSEEIVRKLVKV